LASGYLETIAEVVQRCIARAEGNPLFLDQLLRHAEEHVDSGLPASIQGLVQARLDRLAPADKQALQAASVLGQRFTPEGLSAVLDQPGYGGGGMGRHFPVRPQEDYVLFAQALIQEGVYDSLLKVRRRDCTDGPLSGSRASIRHCTQSILTEPRIPPPAELIWTLHAPKQRNTGPNELCGC